MKAVIVEDEFVAAQSLQRLIGQEDPTIEVMAVLQSVEESVEWFAENQAEIAFMDIHLADGSSFSIFEKVNIQCPVIFTTAYDEYSLKAFEVNSIDYLLKPINQKNLSRALNKLHSLTSRNQNMDQVAQLIASINRSVPTHKSHFLIPHKDKLLPLPTDNIAYIFSEYKMAKFMTYNQQSYVLDSSLDELIKQLDPALFFRANRQFILSHRAITDMSLWFNGKLSVNLSVDTPEKVIVSRARVSEFKSWYTRYSN